MTSSSMWKMLRYAAIAALGLVFAIGARHKVDTIFCALVAGLYLASLFEEVADQLTGRKR